MQRDERKCEREKGKKNCKDDVWRDISSKINVNEFVCKEKNISQLDS